MTREEAIQKALKLLKLSQSNNVHEAALAAQRAQELLAKYEIEQSIIDTELNGPGEKEEPIERFDHDPLEPARGNFPTWKSYLSASVAKANGCRVFLSPGAKRNTAGVVIVGRRSDAQTTRYMYQMLCGEVERLTELQRTGLGKTWYNNFRLGVVDAIAKKLDEAKRKAQEEMRRDASSNSAALIKVDDAIARIEAKRQAVIEWERENLKLRSWHARWTPDQEARARGQAAGANISIGGAKGGLGQARTQIE